MNRKETALAQASAKCVFLDMHDLFIYCAAATADIHHVLFVMRRCESSIIGLGWHKQHQIYHMRAYPIGFMFNRVYRVE